MYGLPEEKSEVGYERCTLFYYTFGVVDYEQYREVVSINGDLGRLDGLLKLWLTDDVRTAQFVQSKILTVLRKIEATKKAMDTIMTRVVMSSS